VLVLAAAAMLPLLLPGQMGRTPSRTTAAPSKALGMSAWWAGRHAAEHVNDDNIPMCSTQGSA
jgi:hypothetical protein